MRLVANRQAQLDRVLLDHARIGPESGWFDAYASNAVDYNDDTIPVVSAPCTIYLFDTLVDRGGIDVGRRDEGEGVAGSIESKVAGSIDSQVPSSLAAGDIEPKIAGRVDSQIEYEEEEDECLAYCAEYEEAGDLLPSVVEERLDESYSRVEVQRETVPSSNVAGEVGAIVDGTFDSLVAASEEEEVEEDGVARRCPDYIPTATLTSESESESSDGEDPEFYDIVDYCQQAGMTEVSAKLVAQWITWEPSFQEESQQASRDYLRENFQIYSSKVRRKLCSEINVLIAFMSQELMVGELDLPTECEIENATGWEEYLDHCWKEPVDRWRSMTALAMLIRLRNSLQDDPEEGPEEYVAFWKWWRDWNGCVARSDISYLEQEVEARFHIEWSNPARVAIFQHLREAFAEYAMNNQDQFRDEDLPMECLYDGTFRREFIHRFVKGLRMEGSSVKWHGRVPRISTRYCKDRYT